MYLPIFRGRQFELIALRECVEQNLIGFNIIPIVEPVKATSTFTKTLDAFIQKGHEIAIIKNPIVGSWSKDIAKESNADVRDNMKKFENKDEIIPSFYVTKNFNIGSIPIDKLILICNSHENISEYEKVIGGSSPRYNLISDKGDFRRRIRPNRIICEDHFPKQPRNVDYVGVDDEFFSSDHLYYGEDGYKGFSDYSIIGEEYNEIGFAPYAVAIHIVYFDNEKNLRIAHFVSDSNDDISDPARKFEEAVGKLVEWNKNKKLDTFGIKAFEDAFKNKSYPGLGVVKKYSIMHHLELISRYLDEVKK